MPVYSATFFTGSIATSGDNDLFDITAPSAADTRSMLLIREIAIGQFSEGAETPDEMLSIRLIRGFTVAGGGSAITPVNLDPRSRAANTTVKGVSTTLANTGTTELLVADTLNVRAGWLHRPPDRRGCILLSPGQRLVARISAPADVIDKVNGTLIFEELGAAAP